MKHLASNYIMIYVVRNGIIKSLWIFNSRISNNALWWGRCYWWLMMCGENLKELIVHAFKAIKSGSKVIMTTRQWHILYDYSDGIYDVDFLDENDALKLFSSYVFHEVNDKEHKQLDDQATWILWKRVTNCL